MSDNPNALLPHLRNDSAIQPPYSNSQISETALYHEIMRIYENARPETKVYYNLGHDTEGVAPENWVIRWMLWHVFRYRDSRNRNRRLPSPGDSRERSSDASGTCSSSADNGAGKCLSRLEAISATTKKLDSVIRWIKDTYCLLGSCARQLIGDSENALSTKVGLSPGARKPKTVHFSNQRGFRQ